MPEKADSDGCSRVAVTFDRTVAVVSGEGLLSSWDEGVLGGRLVDIILGKNPRKQMVKFVMDTGKSVEVFGKELRLVWGNKK